MSSEQLLQEVINLCEDRNNFLVQLHVYNRLDDQAYEKLISVISAYVQLIKDETYIHRGVFGCVYYFVCEMENRLADNYPRSDQEMKKITGAHVKALEILETLRNRQGSS